jgi:hypothetical protein
LKQTYYVNYIFTVSSVKQKIPKNGWIGAVKGAVKGNFGAVKGPEGAVVTAKSSREGLAGPGNPASIQTSSARKPSPLPYKIRLLREETLTQTHGNGPIFQQYSTEQS